MKSQPKPGTNTKANLMDYRPRRKTTEGRGKVKVNPPPWAGNKKKG